jgi:hypothetical protein
MAYTYKGTVRDLEEDHQPQRQRVGAFDPSKCGTYAGYRAHQTYGVPACQDCKDAQAAYTRDYIERRGGWPQPTTQEFKPGACGTYAGFTRHKRAGDAPCSKCREAYALYMRDYRQRRACA